jgi:hypothetical protein
MGFPNVDLILRDIFIAGFAAAQNAPEATVADLFDDRSPAEQLEVVRFLNSRTFTGDTRDRGDARRVFILPHFPTADLPFPQIGVYSGEVDANDRALGDYQGEATEVIENAELVGWAQEMGYWEMSSWNIDVVTASKEEAIWLARFCQYFICQELRTLTVKGVVEVGIAMSDLRAEKGTLQPLGMFVRGVKIHAKVANTWTKRLPLQSYASGNNLAL